jgi:hypothetical protein
MIRRLRALGRDLRVRPLRYRYCFSSGGSLDQTPHRIGFAIIVRINQSLRGTGGTLMAFSQISSNSIRSVTIIG